MQCAKRHLSIKVSIWNKQMCLISNNVDVNDMAIIKV